MACVDLPAFPLQLLLQRHPEWKAHPVVVVDRDAPQGKVLWLNERARSLRILPGMRYAAALSLARELRAGELRQSEIDSALDSMCRKLRLFTPDVEPAAEEPGVFWLDATGLVRLHGSWTRWANLIQSDLKRDGFLATVVVGFSRFGTYAVAKARRGVVVFKDSAGEKVAERRVPLDRLALEPEVRDTLDKLGIRTVGAFLKLPPDGLKRRLGPETERLYRLASGKLWAPLRPRAPEIPAERGWMLDHPETDVARLMRIAEQLLDSVLQVLAGRGQALTEVSLHFTFDRLGRRHESLRPAAPTLDAPQLLQLIRLRLETTRLPDGVVELVLQAQGMEATQEQLQLFAQRPRRDLEAANRALARVRAELGDDAVVRARLRPGHLPEGSFTWEALTTVAAARPRPARADTLLCMVRRIFSRPVPLPPRSRREPDGWMLGRMKHGPVVRQVGPYIISGGWWRKPVHREYHFVETQKGELFWVFYDRTRRRWFLHGRVE